MQIPKVQVGYQHTPYSTRFDPQQTDVFSELGAPDMDSFAY